MSTLAERLKQAREKANLSQQQVADLAGMKQPAYYKVESGKTKRTTFLNEIAKALGVSVDWLLTGKEPTLTPPIEPSRPRINEGFVEAGFINSEKQWVPVKSFSKMGMDGFYTDMGYLGDGGDGYIPSATASNQAFAVKGTGGSMHPAIRDGWYCVCDPMAQPIHGEYVQVCLKDGRCTIKEFISLQNHLLTLLSVNSGERLTFDMSEVESVIAVIDIVPPSRHRQDYPSKH